MKPVQSRSVRGAVCRPPAAPFAQVSPFSHRRRGSYSFVTRPLLRALSDTSDASAADRDALAQQLQAAVAQEDYREAARIKKLIEGLEIEDPIALLQRQLDDAIQHERYDEAAALRDRITELKPVEPPPTKLPCSSDTVTEGIRIVVNSYYALVQSAPSARQFFFIYKVRIANEGSATVQLLSRHWAIVDGQSEPSHVRGPGVVGKQPVLGPGEAFDYNSFCPLTSPLGYMEGEFLFAELDQLGSVARQFQAKIGKFGLDADGPAIL